MVEEFLLDRRARGLAARTVEWYGEQLAHAPFGSMAIRPKDVREFLVEYARDHNPGGVHGFYRALRAMLNWYHGEYGGENPIERVPPPKVPRQILDPVEVADVQALLATCRKTFYGYRDRALLMFMLDTGCRLGELIALDCGDVSGGSVLVRRGKGGFRTVFVGAKTQLALVRYMRHRKESPPLWVMDDGQRITRYCIRSMLERRAEKAGVPAPSPHMFRRAFAINCLRAGMDLVTLQRLLGHSTLAVVSRYLKQVDEDLSTAHKAMAPVDRFL
jgi:integrase/recombinase XerD